MSTNNALEGDFKHGQPFESFCQILVAKNEMLVVLATLSVGILSRRMASKILWLC